tara:strand:+ start:112 stop:294 length:183 start_codon:yes stop_codon:yes gene_type:complete
MSYPKYSGHGRIERNKLVSKKISILSSENDNLPKNKKKKHKQLVAIALDTYPKRRKLPLT